MSLTTDDLCKILHFALAREMRAHGVNDLNLDNGISWDEAPNGYRLALRGAVTSMELVTRKDERDAYRREIMDCMDDLARNPRA